MNEGFGKDFYRKGNSVKRSGPLGQKALDPLISEVRVYRVLKGKNAAKFSTSTGTKFGGKARHTDDLREGPEFPNM